MPKIDIQAGATSVSVNVFIRASNSTTGAGLTGLVFNTASLTAYYMLPRAASVQITLATLAAVTSVYSSGGFKEIDATNAPGWYRLDIPDAALASGRFVDIHLQGAANMAPTPVEIALTGWNNQDAVRGGLTALPNANAAANGGLPILGANAFAISFTAGLTISNASGDALTLSSSGGNGNGITVAGNGSGQGIKLTPGATGHGLYVLGGATSGSAARFEALVTPAQGIHVLGFGTGAGLQVDGGATGDGIKSTAGSGGVDLRANITGNITGNVSGSVASVTARVTANTDQLAGQTVTAAAGVTFPASVASPTNITAGTITTATNLTNAPTSGDFTATMKTSLNAATPSVTVSDKTGFSLSAGGVQAIWDALTSALTTVGSIGRLLVTNVDAAISTRLASSSITLSAGAVTVGTNNDKTGYALTSAYDPAKTVYAVPGDAMALTSGERTTLTGVIWANASRTLTSFGTLVADIATAVWAAGARTLTAFGFTVTTDVSSLVTTNLDTTVSSRLATSGYTVPPTATQNADALLTRDWTSVSGEAARSVLNALRFLRNKWSLTGTSLTVTKENDTTTAWTGTVGSTAGADPVTSVDPT